MGKGKGHFKSDMLKLNRGVDHSPIKKKMEEEVTKIIKNNSRHVAHAISSPYVLDFESKSFGHICIKQLRSNSNTKDIQLFFDEFEKTDVVVLTVKDQDNPSIDERSYLMLEFKNHTRKIHARFFRAILPQELKKHYMNKYPDQYERLKHLLLDADKEIDLDENR